MEKEKSLLKIIATIVFDIILTIIATVSCNQGKTIGDSNNRDTVAAKEFMPHVENGKLNADSQSITFIRFSKYRTAEAMPSISDSVSSATGEESVESGNYSTTLLLDTTSNKEFYQGINLVAQHGTCWDINKFVYIYEKKNKAEGVYKVVFSKGGQQIFVTHSSKDMIKSTNQTKPNK